MKESLENTALQYYLPALSQMAIFQKLYTTILYKLPVSSITSLAVSFI
jgi:hypothetical protein